MKKDYSKLIVTDYSKYINKRLSLEKIEEMFPGKWVALSDCEYNRYSRLESGVLRAVCKDDEFKGTEKIISEKYTKIYWTRIEDILGITLIW
jgi:hypothetical protein